MKCASVEEEYRKYPQLQKSEVEKFVEWSKQQKHLPDISEFWACCFLHACKFSLEVAKQTYDLHCTTRTVCPDFFSSRDILGKDMIDTMNTIAFYPIPKKTSEGDKVFIIKLLDVDPGKFNFAHCVKLCTMCIELWQYQEGIADGIILVFDMKGSQFGHVTRIPPFQLKKFIFYLQETPPVRLKTIHFIHAPSFADKVVALMRPFTKKELLEQLLLHSKMDTFYKCVPKDLLPVEYGGSGGSIDEGYPQIYANAKENREFFLEEERTGRTNEKLREGKPKDASDLFGAEGNFKKLELD